MERLLKAMVACVFSLGVLVGVTWLFLRPNQAPKATVSRPATPAAAGVDASADHSCHEAVVLTLQSYSGVSALMTVQNPEGQDIPTTSASENEGRFTTAVIG